MNKISLRILLVAAVVVGCGGGSDNPPTTSPTPTPTPVTPPAVTQVAVAPAALALVGAGQNGTLTATVSTASGPLTSPTVSWSSNNTGIATVTGTGASATVTSVAVGNATITATSGGQSANATVTVSQPPQALTLSITGDGTGIISASRSGLSCTNSVCSASYAFDSTVVLTATPTGGSAFEGWSGACTGNAACTLVMSQPRSASAAFRRLPVPVASVSIAPTLVALDEGGTTVLTAEVRDASGNVLTGRTVTWTSSDTTLATVSATGAVSARLEGDTVTITATAEGVNGSAKLVVRSLYFLARDVSAGGTHTCAIRVAGGVWCWGTNSNGQLGNPISRAGVPVKPVNGDNFVQVVTGTRHSCALDAQGRAHCWGYGANGELGDSLTVRPRSSSPLLVHGNRTFIRLVAGIAATCGLTQGGAAYCWGENRGYLGTGTTGDVIVPRIIVGGYNWASLSGGTILCGITTSGQSLCWGPGSGSTIANRIGDGTLNSRAVPTAIAGNPAFVKVSAGHDMGCAIDVAGDAWCWGQNRSGQLGIGNFSATSVPVRVQSSEKFISIAAAQIHVCALSATGQAWCWGEGRQGQLGNNTSQNSALPVAVAQGAEVYTQISASDDHTCAIAASRRVFCWGYNAGGSLGFAGGRSLIPLPVSRPEP